MDERTGQLEGDLDSPRPVGLSERIVALDVLRGFALLGILVPNIQAYSMVSIAYRNPTVYGDFSGGNYVVWFLTNLLCEQKFMTIFSALFGAGMILMTSRAAKTSDRPSWLQFRRMGWLLVFGLVHAYALWYGDILVCYAVAGTVAYFFRNLRPRWLMVVGILSLAVAAAISLFFGWSMQYWPAEAVIEFRQEWQPSAEAIQRELDAYRGGWLEQLRWRAPESFFFETFLLLIFLFWRAGGLMLIGMALFKLGVITGERSNRFYFNGALVGLLVGLPLVAFGLQQNVVRDFVMEYSFFFGDQINYWASLFVSFGYLSIIMLMVRSGAVQWLQICLAAVGRMALTNYIAHSVICTTIFYGHGFGYFGYLDRVQQIGVVVTIWILQLVISPIWLHYFNFGPLEWLWRSLVYKKRQPMRRDRTVPASS